MAVHASFEIRTNFIRICCPPLTWQQRGWYSPISSTSLMFPLLKKFLISKQICEQKLKISFQESTRYSHGSAHPAELRKIQILVPGWNKPSPKANLTIQPGRQPVDEREVRPGYSWAVVNAQRNRPGPRSKTEGLRHTLGSVQQTNSALYSPQRLAHPSLTFLGEDWLYSHQRAGSAESHLNWAGTEAGNHTWDL